MTKSVSTYSQSLYSTIAGNMSEAEHRFRQRGQEVQTGLTRISISTMIPYSEFREFRDRQEGWIAKMLNQLQGVMEQWNETTKAANSIEEVNAALTSEEVRGSFDERTNKFNIRYDIEYDNQEDKDNFEEVSKVVDELFENVKGMVQDNWIIQREEESRRLSRSRMVFDQTSHGGSQLSSIGGSGPGGQMGTGTKMYENKGIGGQTQGVFAYGGEPRTNLQQSNDQQNQSNHQQMMFMSVVSKYMQQQQQEAERMANQMSNQMREAERNANQMSNQMSDAGQRYQQREMEMNMLLSNIEQMMGLGHDKTKTAEFISEWKQGAINQVQEVVDGLHNMDRLYLTHSNEEIDEVERAIFDDPIRRLLHAAVGDPQEGERQNIDDYYRGGEISECIKSMVVWKRIMRNAARQLEDNERMERSFRRSRELWTEMERGFRRSREFWTKMLLHWDVQLLGVKLTAQPHDTRVKRPNWFNYEDVSKRVGEPNRKGPVEKVCSQSSKLVGEHSTSQGVEHPTSQDGSTGSQGTGSYSSKLVDEHPTSQEVECPTSEGGSTGPGVKRYDNVNHQGSGVPPFDSGVDPQGNRKGTTNQSDNDEYEVEVNDEYEVEVEQGSPLSMVDADNDSEGEEHHPTSGWDLNRLLPRMSDDDDSHSDTFTLKEGNAIQPSTQCLNANAIQPLTQGLNATQCLTINDLTQCLNATQCLTINDDHATQCFNTKKGNTIQSVKATQCFNENDDRGSHRHIDTSRIGDTGLGLVSRCSTSCTRPAGRISRRATVHNEMKQGSERNTDVDTVETAFRVMTRLNGDLRWMWNKLQAKHPEGLTSLRIHKVEEPIDIKDNEDEVWEIIKTQKREEKVCSSNRRPTFHQSGKLVHQTADLQFTSRNTGLSSECSTLLRSCHSVIKLMESVEETNQVEAERVSCNASIIESNHPFTKEADLSCVHGFINHRGPGVVTRTFEKSSSDLREKFGTMVERDLQIEVVCETSDELTEDDDDINDREDDYPQFITPTLWGKVKDDTSNTMVRQLERSFLLTRRVQRVRKRERSNRS